MSFQISNDTGATNVPSDLTRESDARSVLQAIHVLHADSNELRREPEQHALRLRVATEHGRFEVVG